jgi:hypothetical protein
VPRIVAQAAQAAPEIGEVVGGQGLPRRLAEGPGALCVLGPEGQVGRLAGLVAQQAPADDLLA